MTWLCVGTFGSFIGFYATCLLVGFQATCLVVCWWFCARPGVEALS